tara:strand:- start:33 stop:701 length:669 start_codon:yes stop_codon:yes gene_type:complete
MKNLLIFYGELRALPLIISQYNLDGFDIVVSTWDNWQEIDTAIPNNIEFNPNDYDNLKMIVSKLYPTYTNLKSHQNCIIYHCWNVIKNTDLTKYDNVILQRTDMCVQLDNINLNLVEDDVFYRLFGNTNGPNGPFMNDVIMVGKSNTVKQYFKNESTILPSKKELKKWTTELPPYLSGWETKSVTESVWGGEIKDIQKHLTEFEDYPIKGWESWIKFYRRII